MVVNILHVVQNGNIENLYFSEHPGKDLKDKFQIFCRLYSYSLGFLAFDIQKCTAWVQLLCFHVLRRLKVWLYLPLNRRKCLPALGWVYDSPEATKHSVMILTMAFHLLHMVWLLLETSTWGNNWHIFLTMCLALETCAHWQRCFYLCWM